MFAIILYNLIELTECSESRLLLFRLTKMYNYASMKYNQQNELKNMICTL